MIPRKDAQAPIMFTPNGPLGNTPQVDVFEPYVFLAKVGKKVIHPGGRPATEHMFRLADFKADHRVLEVGCGVGTTAMAIARQFGCHVTAIDIDSYMVERARANVRSAGLEHKVTVEQADILTLPFDDCSFDRILIETVTIFVDRIRAAKEIVRVCKTGGRVIDHEFMWLRDPPSEIRKIIEVQLCPSHFEGDKDWEELYRQAGVVNLQTITDLPTLMTLRGMLRDEGLVNTIRIASRICFSWSNLRTTVWMMKRLGRAMPYLGWVLIAGEKPESTS